MCNRTAWSASAALELPGAEPLQGALADFFMGRPDAPAADKLEALRLCAAA
jgi:hypothetical protein